MKKLQFIVTSNGDDKIVQDAFDQYFLNPKPITLLNLAQKVLAHAMATAGIDKMDLVVSRSIFAGGYGKGGIKLNKSLFKHVKRKQTLMDLIECIMHELTHAIIEKNNLRILETKTRVSGYLPSIDLGRITEILNITSDDIEFACATSMYLYRRNKNELIARKHAHYLMQKYLKTFAGNITFDIKSFEDKEKQFQDRIYKDYPNVKCLAKHIGKMINDYQLKLINCGLNNISEDELDNLVSSINVQLYEETKSKLVKACAMCGDVFKVKRLLQTPLINVTSSEKRDLQQIYGSDVIESFVFADCECQRNI